MESNWILYMATYPPRECGIATFTKDLITAMDKKFAPFLKSKILVMNNNNDINYENNKDVLFDITDNAISSYKKAAKRVNEINSIKLINIQHEFGIFGGEYGNCLLKFLEIVKKPVIISFHTVIPNPNDKLKKIVRKLAKKSSFLVVMTNKGIDILRKDYKIKKEIFLIHHGTPTVSFDNSIKEKTVMGIADKIVLSTFGLINSGKGYEYVIESLIEVVKKYPNILLLIIGETHPVVRKQEGEKYRNFLKEKVKECKLEKYVKFYNRYMTLEEIVKFLLATDIYICSNQNPNQIVSGTLAYAIACGRAIISTPYTYAKDMIIPERGLLVKFRDHISYTSALLKILSNPLLREKMEIKNYSFSRRMIWPNVAISHYNVFKRVIPDLEKYEMSYPEINFDHIKNLTDDFGIIQFANYAKPDKSSGYTLDDNVRALIACTLYFKLFKDNTKLKLMKIYLNFIKYVHKNDNKLYNIVNYERVVNLEHWSEDAHGRAMNALGHLIATKNIPIELRVEAERIFENAKKVVDQIRSPRAVSFILIGLYFYNDIKNSEVIRIKKLADYLTQLYKECNSENWHWFENYLTYSNSKLPEALFFCYKTTKDDRYLLIAKESLDFLISLTFKDGKFAPIGQNGWHHKNGHSASHDQQPVDAASMVQTLTVAFDITKEDRYMKLTIEAFHWFLGKNSLNQEVYNNLTGGCHDGVGENSLNMNQGAESSISYLLARLSQQISKDSSNF
ncbi:MAG TPA: glycosyltransferase [archaeon]|nr:glycosyltransferase [archaeon]